MNIKKLKSGVLDFKKKFDEAWEVSRTTDRNIVIVGCILFCIGLILSIVRIIAAFIQGGD
jgi:hypothetical protein